LQREHTDSAAYSSLRSGGSAAFMALLTGLYGLLMRATPAFTSLLVSSALVRRARCFYTAVHQTSRAARANRRNYFRHNFSWKLPLQAPDKQGKSREHNDTKSSRLKQ
jgi:hypothetical protein